MADVDVSNILEITGQVGQLEKKFLSAIERLDQLCPVAIGEILESVYQLSQVYVPVKTGALKMSGYVEVFPNPDEDGVWRGEVGYGAEGFPEYADVVHEMETYHHTPPTQAKYLELAFEEILPNIEEQIRRKFEKGFEEKMIAQGEYEYGD